MTHACEAYYCLAKNPLSDATALTAIRLISGNILNVIKKPGDLQDGRPGKRSDPCRHGVFKLDVGMVHTWATRPAARAECRMEVHESLPSIRARIPHAQAIEEIGELLFALAGPEVYAATPVKRRPGENDRIHTKAQPGPSRGDGRPSRAF